MTLWCRSKKQAERVTSLGENARYLPGIPIPSDVQTTDNLQSAMSHSECWILAIPTQAVRSILKQLSAQNVSKTKVSVCNVAKGIEIESLLRISQIVEHEAPWMRYSILSGPTLAKEVAQGLPAAAAVASSSPSEATLWQTVLNGSTFRVYTSTDVCGVETGGALKNVIAIASGMAHRMQAGDNATAALVTRGLAEITRLGVAMGAYPITLAGLAGIGDLMVTAYSRHSRNFRLGMALEEGLPLAKAMETLGQVAEGAFTVQAATALGKRLDVDLPISRAVHRVLYEGVAPASAMQDLMARDPKPEYPMDIFRDSTR